MVTAWETYPGAPAPGDALCDLADIPDPGTHSVNIGDFSVLLARRGGQVWAYVNACPHQYLPLDYRAADVLSADRAKLICSNHDAVFDVETGTGLGGFGQGCALDPVPVAIGASGRISIAAA